MNKETIIETIKKMPDDALVDDIIDRILFVKSIEDAIHDMDEGNVVEHEEIETMIQQWRKELPGQEGQSTI